MNWHARTAERRRRLEARLAAAQAFEHAFAETGAQTVTVLATSGAYAQLQLQVLR